MLFLILVMSLCLHSFTINSPVTADVLVRQPAPRSGHVDFDELGVKAIFLTEAKVFATDHDVGVAFQWSCFRKDLNKNKRDKASNKAFILFIFSSS